MKKSKQLFLLALLGALVSCQTGNNSSNPSFPISSDIESNDVLSNESIPSIPSPIDSTKPIPPSISDGNITKENYYDDIDDSLVGNDLRAALAVATSRQFKEHEYKDLKDIYPYSDVNSSGEMIMFYTGTARSFSPNTLPGRTNKEHVWPQSWYGSGGETHYAGSPGADAHNVFPCDSQTNNIRSSNSYDVLPQTSGTRVYEGGTGGSYGERDGNLNYGVEGDLDSFNYVDKENKIFYPRAGYRGITARALMYVATRYYLDDRFPVELVDEPKTSAETGKYGRVGKLSTLLAWHLQEPPTEFEMKRNDAIFERWHYNRNPFVDNPSYACRIWSSYNDNTARVCEGEKTEKEEIRKEINIDLPEVYIEDKRKEYTKF